MKSKTNQTSKNISENTFKEIERVKLDLLSLVSHELRTPLTSVLNAIQLLREEGLDLPERQELLEMAHRNAERLNATLSQLLDLSKLVSGRLVCRLHEVSLKNLVMAKIELFEIQAREAGFELHVSGRATDLPVILGDAPRLEQVIRAVFDNALKFSPPGSKITLKFKSGRKRIGKRPEAASVWIEISNHIKEDAAVSARTDELLKVFSQQESVLDRAHEGVGGSLALGAEVLRQHGGILQLAVERGIFTASIVLPHLESEQALLKVLESRIYALKTEVGGVSLMLLEVGERSFKQVFEALKAALFRASDTVYGLAHSGQIAVVMDDCKKADAPKIVRRLLDTLGPESNKLLKPAKVGLSNCPEDATDPEKLLDQARCSFIPISEF